MNAKLKEIKDLINNSKDECGNLDFFIQVYHKFDEVFNQLTYKYIETLYTKDDFWGISETNVYEFSETQKDGNVKSIGCLAVKEAVFFKIEGMSIDNCYFIPKAYDVRKTTKPHYELIREEK